MGMLRAKALGGRTEPADHVSDALMKTNAQLAAVRG